MHSPSFPVLLILSCCAASLGARAQSAPAAQEPAAQEPAAQRKLAAEVYDHFGTGIVEGPSTDVATALAKPDEFSGKTVRLTGRITGVCQTKGCWMHLGAQSPPVMVKFKDYGFFVPKDASGRTAVVEGEMTLRQETVEQTRHYLEDAGKHDEAAKVTEGRKLYTFVATGVAIHKPVKLDPARYDHFGAGIIEGPATDVAMALAKPEEFTGKVVRLSGPVTAVCQTKGCWMHLGTQTPPVMVKFKDYGFFVPKDASGRTAILEGEMTMRQETVEQTRHYLEDAGKHDEAAKVTEGRKLWHFVATGVALEKPKS